MIAPPWYPVPPIGYGGIELVVSILTRGLRARGHEVILFAADDSVDPAVGLAPSSWRTDLGNHFSQELRSQTYAARVSRHLAVHGAHTDLIHDHSGLGALAALIALDIAPTVHTVHGPVTEPLAGAIQSLGSDVSLVAISHNQLEPAPWLPWEGVVHNAVDVDSLRLYPPGDKDGYLLVLARICPDKGQHHAIEVARRTGRDLVLAGKVDPGSEAYFETEIAPHLDGTRVRWLPDVGGTDKERLLGRATALLAPITWPEPFGLSMVEAMVSGTPTIAFRRGAAPELVEHGQTGFLVDTVDEMVAAVAAVPGISPAECAVIARSRFSPDAMVEGYLRVYAGIIASAADDRADRPELANA